MKTRHIQEMSPWPDDRAEELPAPDFRFFQGLMVGIPLGVLIWTAILWGVW